MHGILDDTCGWSAQMLGGFDFAVAQIFLDVRLGHVPSSVLGHVEYLCYLLGHERSGQLRVCGPWIKQGLGISEYSQWVQKKGGKLKITMLTPRP